MPVRASFQPSGPQCLALGIGVGTQLVLRDGLRRLPAPKFSGGLAVVPLCVVAQLALELGGGHAVKHPTSES